MLEVLSNRAYARLFSAQVVALLGTGLLTVALGLAAYEIAGAQASVVLGVALTIKMVAYVGFSPIASALISELNRKKVLVYSDLIRAVAALFLPFIDAAWQIYVLVFVLQAASATFTPAFQATIPDILTKEADYTKALSLSRLAYDLENIVSPVVAGLLLTVIGFHWLFAGTAIGFLVSSYLVLVATVPAVSDLKHRGFFDRLTRGSRIYLATPRLRGLLLLNLAAASVGAMVIVNTVVVVRSLYGGSEPEVALALAMFGCGSMVSALALPRLLDHLADRTVMATGAVLVATLLTGVGAVLFSGISLPWLVLLSIWFLTGLFYSSILTPSGRLLRRSAHSEDRPALFAAQFALSHACWLLTYPLSGFLFASAGMGWTMIVLGSTAGIAALAGLLLWPRDDADVIEHSHDEMPEDHPHLRNTGRRTGAHSHAHAFVIDDEHRVWPTHG
ncbi:MFS transporter [Hoeflea prorocentri]|uniref:MFS transporter n=1 Tax=Hoeflea prorocentri TaxID=1922333 RepID=A0A9X3UEE9_9HYPH|nr:MFS transporter [Hoeflea prorocentri]MCY6379893.1 MFS transporter [Hoeflea prorocentri]MDA5397693.1 MFS transporter [Hoeflea prorocentri]